MTRWIPSATYRIQLSRSFGFDDARRIVPHLDRLGVDTIYLSPILAARRGSSHGYDCIDPRRIDADRGGAAGFRRLCRAASAHGLRVVVDIVPNHLSATLENPAWRDLLQHGPASKFASLFDIDWRRTPHARPQVVLPWLDREVDRAFTDGTLAVELRGGRVGLQWGTRHLPGSVDAARKVRSWSRSHGLGALRNGRTAVQRVLRGINAGATGVDRRRRTGVLGALPYRVVPWWQFEAINYRRFFDISELAGARADRPSGFAYLHRKILAEVRAGRISGVRVDHIDGIADPLGYLRRLRRALDARSPRHESPYLVVEKILGADEALPEEWPVDGSTGYDALDRITRVLLVPGREREIDRAFRRAVPGRRAGFPEIARQAKYEVAMALFPGERRQLARWFVDRHGTAADEAAWGRAIVRLTSELPVYRTYARGTRRRAEDQRRWAAAFRSGRKHAPRARRPELERLRTAWPGPVPFVRRWQQWTGAVAAKGIEDTAFYRYARWLGLNEVGGDPAGPVGSLETFHRFMERRATSTPHALTATSTHDTKWGEDARARLIALAEAAEPWGRAAVRWRSMRRPRRPAGDLVLPADVEYRLYQALAATAPAPAAFSRAYRARFEGYAVKAEREAKRRTSWIAPDREYEASVVEFVRALFQDPRAQRFRTEMTRWIDRLARIGAYYSLAQVVLRSTLPGVPDLYQGSEGWNLSLVDPDNRRPVDYRSLARCVPRRSADPPSGRSAGPGPAPHRPRERDKVELTWRLLQFRRRHRPLFERGGYRPVIERDPPPSGAVLAYLRRSGSEHLLVAVGRGLTRVAPDRERLPVGTAWRGRTLRLREGFPTHWTNVVDGRSVTTRGEPSGPVLLLREVFSGWPFAVLYHSGTA